MELITKTLLAPEKPVFVLRPIRLEFSLDNCVNLSCQPHPDSKVENRRPRFTERGDPAKHETFSSTMTRMEKLATEVNHEPKSPLARLLRNHLLRTGSLVDVQMPVIISIAVTFFFAITKFCDIELEKMLLKLFESTQD